MNVEYLSTLIYEAVFTGKEETIYDDFMTIKATMIAFTTLNTIKTCLALNFILVRTMEQEMLLLFIKHQRKYSLKFLYVTKDTYRRIE